MKKARVRAVERSANTSAGNNRHHSHHHRRKKSLHRRIRHWLLHHRKRAAVTAVICLAAAAALGFLAYRNQQKQASMQIRAGNSHDVGNGFRELTYKGKKYRYNSLVKTILYAGIDEEGILKSSKQYGNKGRADTIAVVVFDKQSRKISVLSINRDTMTQIRRYSLNGNDNGLYTSHIGYAYSYGDGGKASCENLREAVSLLLGGIPIADYIVTSQASMPYINDLVGGITLTVPNSDLEARYPEMAEGSTITLDDSNIETYLRYRDTDEDFSNEGRLQRQKAYATAYINKLREMSTGDLEDKWTDLSNMEDYLQTSITRNKYLDLVSLIQDLEFSDENYDQLAGQDQQGELHDEFIPDEDALQEEIIKLFYEEA